MAIDNLELALRVRADMESAIDGLSRMEAEAALRPRHPRAR